MAQTTITGIEEVVRLINQIGRAPAKVLTKATKMGANIIRSDGKNSSPRLTGTLVKAMKLKAEKRKTGKKVYQIKFIGEKLVKISKDGNRSFYPTSQEYGWKTKGGKLIEPPKKYFLKNAFRRNKSKAYQIILNEMKNSLRTIIRGN